MLAVMLVLTAHLGLVAHPRPVPQGQPPTPQRPPPVPPAAAEAPSLDSAYMASPRRVPPAKMEIAARATTTTISLLAAPEVAAAAQKPLGAQKRLRALADQLSSLPRTANLESLERLLDGQNLVEHNLTTLLLSCKRRQKWRVAALLAEWSELPHCPLPFTTTHYNLLLSACARRAPKRALAMLRRMLARGVPTDVVTHNTAMTAALALDGHEEALQLFDEMRCAWLDLAGLGWTWLGLTRDGLT
jgi:hypothetical protein